MELKKIHISDIGKVVTGKTPRTSIIENYGGSIPFLTPSDDLSRKSAPKTTKTLTKRGLDEVKNCLLPPHSVCVSCIGSDLGKVVMTLEPTVTNQQFNSIIPSKSYNADFVYYLMTLVGKELNYLSKTSTAVPIINKSSFSNYEVEVPNLETQEKIASILSSLDDKIELNRRINDNLEQQAQALFKAWFVDFEPFKDGKFVDSELGRIPEGWKAGNIYKYVDVIYGAPYKSTMFNQNKNGYPLIRIRDLKTFSPQFYTPEILPNMEFVHTGDVIAGMDAEFVPTLWLGNKGILNQRCCKFVAKKEFIGNYYILYLLKPELEFVQTYKTGTTVSHLGKSDIDRFTVVVPPIEIVRSFSVLTNSLLNKKIKLAQENSNLTILRDTLLPRLMSGELSINTITE